MKYQPGNEQQVLEYAEKKFSEFFPDNPFDYFFLNDYYEQQFRDEKLLGTVFGIFALLAIIVTCLGIFGLTSFMMLQKVKEITIRRVIGSDLSGIIMLFSKEFILITAVSFIIAVPVCWYWFTGWLKTFETRMEISVWNFILPPVITLALTLLTIGLIVHLTVSVNPSDNLRSE